jgi:nuclear transport factor 2 (NTF2) superfamily protein
MDDTRVTTARALFAAWSSNDPDAPRTYLTDDCVLTDIVSGTFSGWDEIRAFFGSAFTRYRDVKLIPEEFWTNDEGVALTWTMTVTRHDGTAIVSPGMSRLSFAPDGRVCLEWDYHHR